MTLKNIQKVSKLLPSIQKGNNNNKQQACRITGTYLLHSEFSYYNMTMIDDDATSWHMLAHPCK